MRLAHRRFRRISFMFFIKPDWFGSVGIILNPAAHRLAKLFPIHAAEWPVLKKIFRAAVNFPTDRVENGLGGLIEPRQVV